MKTKPSQRASKPLTKKKLLKQKNRHAAASAIDADAELEGGPASSAPIPKEKKAARPVPAKKEKTVPMPPKEDEVAVAPLPPADTSRVILKNIPAYMTRERLVERFGEYGQITDCKIPLGRNGTSRQIAFLGFKSAEDAKKCVSGANRTFLDTKRLTVELAEVGGSLGGPATGANRAWSKYTPGTTAHKRLHPELYDAEKSKGKTVGSATATTTSSSKTGDFLAAVTAS